MYSYGMYTQLWPLHTHDLSRSLLRVRVGRGGLHPHLAAGPLTTVHPVQQPGIDTDGTGDSNGDENGIWTVPGLFSQRGAYTVS
jgi:hypothetical protein